jgi:hypothetical protein
MKQSARPRYKVIAASAGAFVAAAATLYTDLFGADVSGDTDKLVKAVVIAVTAFAAGYAKTDGTV